MTTVTCDGCGDLFERQTKEVNRCISRGRKMFCKPICQSEAHTLPSKRDAKCAKCDAGFISNKCKGKWSEYCSRSCASVSNVTELRRSEARRTGCETLNLLPVSETMKRREQWKYQELSAALDSTPHEFEYPLDGFVFDLFLSGEMTLIEFDGDYHRTDYVQMEVDRQKDFVATSNGLVIVRIPVDAGCVIPAESLSLIENARKLCV